MSPPTVIVLLHCFLFAALVQSAPLNLSDTPPAFREAAERAKTLVEKILRELSTVHDAAITTEGLTLDPSTQTTNLQMMATQMGIPAAPVLKPPTESFTLDICMSRMASGSRLFQGLLGVLSEHLSGLSDLRADLRDLHTHINKMKEAAQLSGGEEDQTISLNFDANENYEVQVAAHLTLTQLRSFCHDLIRSLRSVAAYRL